MSISINFIRIVFIFLSILFITTYAVAISQDGVTLTNLTVGVLSGGLLGLVFLALDFLIGKFSLRTLNVITLGLFIGYLFGTCIIFILNASLDLVSKPITYEAFVLLKTMIYLVSCYISTLMTARASEEFYLASLL